MLAADIDLNDFTFVNDKIDSAGTQLLELRQDISLLHKRYAHADVAMIRRLVLSDALTGLAISERATNPNLFHYEQSC